MLDGQSIDNQTVYNSSYSYTSSAARVLEGKERKDWRKEAEKSYNYEKKARWKK